MMSHNKKFLQLFTLTFFVLIILGLILFSNFYGNDVTTHSDKTDSAQGKFSLQKKDALISKDSSSKQNTIHHEKLQAEFHDSIFSFHVFYDSIKQKGFPKEYAIRKIDIMHLPDQKLLQSFKIKDPYYFDSYEEAYQFDMEDMNFDGYTDFSIVSWTMVNGNSQSKFWLYDPSSGNFKENVQLEDTWQTKFDHKNKLVNSWQNMTDSPFSEVNECFYWQNDKMILLHGEECIAENWSDSSTIIMQKRIDGKLVKRSRVYAGTPCDSAGRVIYRWEEMKVIRNTN